MPIYGRYEPAEAMRDLGNSLAGIVTGMAETKLLSSKMDLALKEQDLKLGLLEKQGKIETLATELEGERRKTALAQDKERIDLAKLTQAQSAEHQKAMEGIAKGQLGVSQQELALKQKEYQRLHEPITWKELIPSYLHGPMKQAMGDEFMNGKTTRVDAAPILDSFLKEFKGETINIGLLKTAQELRGDEKRLKELGAAAAQGDMQAAEAAEKLMADRSKKIEDAELISDLMTGKDRIGDIYTKLQKASPETPHEELLKQATEIAHVYKSDMMKTVKGAMDIEDWAISSGLKKDPNPINYASESKAAVDSILKKSKGEREKSLTAILTGIDADQKMRPRQKEILKNMITQDYDSRMTPKTKAPVTPEPAKPMEPAAQKPETGERYAPVAETAKGLWKALREPVNRPGWNERRLREWVGESERYD